MKLSKFKIAFIILSIATIIWIIVFCHTLWEYHKFVEGLDPLIRKWGLWDPWWRWNGMPYVLLAGNCLLVTWVILITSYLLHGRKRENV